LADSLPDDGILESTHGESFSTLQKPEKPEKQAGSTRKPVCSAKKIAKRRKNRNLFFSDVQHGRFSGIQGVWYIYPLRFIDLLMTVPPPSSIFSENAAPRQNQI
jgi:hypothetical protein